MKPIELLAEFFTGTEVAHQSISLGVKADGPLMLRQRAERFFAVRDALGIKGYANKQEAIKAIEKALK